MALTSAARHVPDTTPAARREEVDRLTALAWELSHTDPQRSRAYAEQALELASASTPNGPQPYVEGIAYSLLLLSVAEWGVSHFSAALSLAFKALALFQATGDLARQAYTLNHIAGLHFWLGNYPQALELGFEAIKMSQEIGDRSLEADFLNDTGYTCLHMGNFPDALPQLLKSLHLHREIGSVPGEAHTLDSISKAYYLMGDYAQALSYSQQSLERFRALGYQLNEAETLGNLGKIHAASGDDNQALACFEQSLALARSGGFQQFAAAALLDIGRLYLGQRQTQPALDTLGEALIIAQDIQVQQLIFEIHEALSAAYEQAGDMVKALAHYRQFHLTREGLFNERSNLRLTSLQVMYEVETAKRVAEITQQKNAALEQEIREREQLIAELDAFARTVAHDLKSPLAVIIAYGEMALDSVRTGTDPAKSAELLEEQLAMGYKASRIVDELLLLARVRRQDIKPKPLDMAAIVHEAESRLDDLIAQRAARLVKPAEWPPALGYAPWIEEVWVNYLSNAIRYGGEPPYIELGATPESDAVRFWVRDNGAGLPPDAQARLFTEFTRLDPFHTEGHGLGLSIVKRIVEKLGGSVGVESDGTPGTGCTFSFTLPAAP